MFKLFSLTDRRVKNLIENKTIIKTTTKIEIVITAIEEIQKVEINVLKQLIDALILAKNRLKEQENKKINLETNKIKSLKFKEELEPINRNIKIKNEEIIQFNQHISQKIFKINAEIDNICEEIIQIIKELEKYEHYYLTNLNHKLNEQNQIIKKTKIKQNYTIENTKLETINFSTELNNISDILEQILRYSSEFEKNDVIQLKR